MKLVFSPKAKKDIDQIYDYTDLHWGFEQADHYVHDIRLRCRYVSENPSTGRKNDHIKPGYRFVVSGPHTIFYRETASSVTIIRILHSRMDPSRHL
jgi:toxin ParE1/3/4